MKWFKHDSNANTDTKLKKVKHKYGITGYGLYWYCVELIAESVSPKNITFELEEDAEIIALEWSLDQLKVQEIMQYMVDIGLFEVGSNNQITCFKLAKRLDDTNSKNPQIKHIISGIDSDKVGVTPSDSDKLRLDKIKLDKIKLDNKNKPPKLVIDFRGAIINLGVDECVVSDWLKVRSKKKAANTLTAFNRIKSEIEKSGLTANQAIKLAAEESWSGFKAEWVKNIGKKSPEQQSFKNKDYGEVVGEI